MSSRELPPPPEAFTRTYGVAVQPRAWVRQQDCATASVTYNRTDNTITVVVGGGQYTVVVDFPDKALWDHMQEEIQIRDSLISDK